MFQKERLRKLRKEHGYTQEELADKINSSKATISNYENGYSTPSNETLAELVVLLKTSADYLLGLDAADDPEIKEQGQDGYRPAASELEQIIIEFNRQLSSYEALLPPDKRERFIEKRIRLHDMIRLVYLEEIEDSKRQTKHN